MEDGAKNLWECLYFNVQSGGGIMGGRRKIFLIFALKAINIMKRLTCLTEFRFKSFVPKFKGLKFILTFYILV